MPCRRGTEGRVWKRGKKKRQEKKGARAGSKREGLKAEKPINIGKQQKRQGSRRGGKGPCIQEYKASVQNYEKSTNRGALGGRQRKKKTVILG